MSLLTPRPGLMDIRPYVGGDSTIAGVDRIIKLASNEGAFGPSPRAVAAVRQAVSTGHRYPDGACSALRQAIAEHQGIDPAQIVCGAGSDEIITLLCRAYAGPGDEVLYTEHGFLMYPIAARTVGAKPVAVPEIDLTADVDGLLQAVTPKTRIVFLANPNNPTGSYLSSAAMAELRKRLRDDVLLVIDAAYAEYVDRPDYSPGDDLVMAGSNVVVTRTFSKIYGLGGLRLGWGYCPPPVADVLNRLRNPFNVARPAQAAGVAALEDSVFIAKAHAHNRTWRAWTMEKIQALGLGVPPSQGNFVLARFPDEPGRTAADADAFLRDRGIIVRRMEGYGLPDSLRVTIGLEEEMRAFMRALTEFTDRS